MVGWGRLFRGSQAGFAPLSHPGGISQARDVFHSVIKASPNEVSILPWLASETPRGRAVSSVWQEFALACIQLLSDFPLLGSESCCLPREQTRRITCYMSSGNYVLKRR